MFTRNGHRGVIVQNRASRPEYENVKTTATVGVAGSGRGEPVKERDTVLNDPFDHLNFWVFAKVIN